MYFTDDVLKLLQGAGPIELTLQQEPTGFEHSRESFRRQSLRTRSQSVPPPQCRTVTLQLDTPGNLGFQVLGNVSVKGPVFVAAVERGSNAEQSRQIQEGDQIIAINGLDMSRATQGGRGHCMCGVQRVASGVWQEKRV
jgi:C-terminal processing protease CtpA/Prc